MGKVKQFREDGASRFINVGGTDAFFHVSAVVDGICEIVDARVYVKVEADEGRGRGKFRALVVKREERYREDVASTKLNLVAAEAVAAADESRRRAVATREAVATAELCSMRAKLSMKYEPVDPPPGMDDSSTKRLLWSTRASY